MLITKDMLQLLGEASPLGSPRKGRAAGVARASENPHQLEVTASPFFQDEFLRLAAVLWKWISEVLASFNGETKTRLS